jgi:class 3 adenylate cyclase
VSTHAGAVVKTMGDAIMATFASGRDAVEAAIAIQTGWPEFAKGHEPECGELFLKIGVHEGPAIAFNNHGWLDYFGATVNMAARVADQSLGGDVVLTEATYQDPDVQTFLRSIRGSCDRFTSSLRGIEGAQALCRISPTDTPTRPGLDASRRHPRDPP